MSFHTDSDTELYARARAFLAQDDLSDDELALLPRSYRDIRPARPRLRRLVLHHRVRLAASIAGVVMAAAIIGPPLSAAAAAWLHRPAEPPLPTGAGSAPGNAGAASAARTEYRFTPTTDVVEVHFAGWQDGATLSIARAAGEGATFEVRHSGPAIPVTILPHAIRIGANGANGATVSYRLWLPSSTALVDVRVADDVVWRLSGDEVSNGTILSLAAAPER